MEDMKSDTKGKPIYPIHPRALPGESLESWLLRYAFFNLVSLNRLLFLLGIIKKSWDFDAIEPHAPWFARIRKELGESKAELLLFDKLRSNLGPSWEHWLTPTRGRRPFRRYCASCFLRDEVPYLRLLWRLTFIVVCPEHGVLLRSKCGSCGMCFNPSRPNPYFSVGICPNCGSFLGNDSSRTVSPKDQGAIAVRQLAKLASDGGFNPPTELTGDSKEFLSILSFVSRLLTHKRPTSERMYDRRGSQFLLDEEVYLDVLGEAWSAVTSKAKMRLFIDNNQYRFNREANLVKLPSVLVEYKKIRKIRRIDWRLVYETTNKIYARGEAPNLKKIADETGLNYATLQQAPCEFRNHVKSLAVLVRTSRRLSGEALRTER